MTQQQRKKKTVEYHFVDMNDPDRYKKIKVARACDFCRKRKSKCDIGIPGSGTCSNCKKSNNICIFSPVSSATAAKKERPSLLLSNDSASSASAQSSSSSQNSICRNTPNLLYQTENPFFSMDHRGHCGYEKHDTTASFNHMTLDSSPMHELPPHNKQMEQELFDVYFCYVHPFYPILDRHYILQALKYDSESIPSSLKLAIMALSLHFAHQHQDSHIMATAYYQHALMNLDRTPSLASLQTLFLLHKFQELITPVGLSFSTVAINYLKEIQTMINRLQQPEIDKKRSAWSAHDEFVCRASWLVFIIITFSSTADDRWRSMLDCCIHRSRFPSLTESEHYDTGELNIFCNFMHLIKIALLYSQVLSLISEQSSLFVNADHPEFVKLAQDLEVWKSSLPSRISLVLTADPPILYSAQNHGIANIAHDSSKSGSFTSYICLIHDILDLIISIHRSSTSEYINNARNLDIFDKASQVCYRAHSFTAGDMQAPHFSRLASIQGGRIVSFGLTLALQAQSYVHERSEDRSLSHAKKYYSSCSLAFQVFDDMLLSPQLYMAIQTLRAQLDAKEQLNLADQQQYEHSPFNSSSNSSAQSTPGYSMEETQTQQQRREYPFSRSNSAINTTITTSHSKSNAYFYSNSQHSHNPNEHSPHNQQQEASYHSARKQQPQQWQESNNHSYSSNSNWSNNQAALEQGNEYYTSQGDEYNASVPMTPTFDKDFGMSPPSIDANDPLTPPPVHDTDSYFASQQQVRLPPHQRQIQRLQTLQHQYTSFDIAIAIVSNSNRSNNTFSFSSSSVATNHHSFNLVIQNSKSCKYKIIVD